MSAADPNRWQVIDASRSPEQVQLSIQAVVAQKLGSLKQ
jgi:hypothetical protein